ncbi:probable Sec sixty-one protein homolog [Zygosaccharomyces bailii]|nr:probable Sec sixty-one protein homolog [Zygosaccharomyces bailii]
MAEFRLIDVVKPFLPLLPEVEAPYENVPFDDKIVYTIIAALIYIFGQVPLAGVSKEESGVKDPIYFLRGVFAAEPKTLMEFGIFPLVCSGLMVQLCAAMRIIKVNFKLQHDRELFQSFTKLFAILQYFVLTNIFIWSGYYGYDLSLVQIGLLNVQLVGAGLVAILLSEVIDKGFGFHSGVMTINTVVIATNLVSDTLGVAQIKVDNEGNTEARGSLINLLQSLRSQNKTFLGGIVNSFNRDYLPNLNTTFLVLAIGATVCFLQCFRVELPIRSTKARGLNNVYPIRLLHTGALPVAFSYILLTIIHLLAFVLIQCVAKNDPSSVICRIFGHYENVNNLLYVPTFPLSLLTPPRSLFAGLLKQPLTFLVYTSFMLVSGIWFSYKWQAVSGSSARDLAMQFKEQGITLMGHREQNIAKELGKVIPVASTTGAALLTLVCITGEFLGLKGKAAAMVIGVTTTFSLLELISADYQQSGSQSALAQVLGASGRF